jgi:peptidoglycan hydrolase CwlO-like protein
MEEVQLIGYAVLAIITLGSFIAVVMKFTQPINDLKIVIQKLNDNIDSVQKVNDTHEKRLDKHGDEIDKLDHRVGKLETKVHIYHND